MDSATRELLRQRISEARQAKIAPAPAETTLPPCPECGEPVVKHKFAPRKIYCSQYCQRHFYDRQRDRLRGDVRCAGCGDVFTPHRFSNGSVKFCSKNCGRRHWAREYRKKNPDANAIYKRKIRRRHKDEVSALRDEVARLRQQLEEAA